MYFPQANSYLRQFFRPFYVLLYKNEHFPGLLSFKIIFSSKIDPPYYTPRDRGGEGVVGKIRGDKNR
jgi:hypothetical protein